MKYYVLLISPSFLIMVSYKIKHSNAQHVLVFYDHTFSLNTTIFFNIIYQKGFRIPFWRQLGRTAWRQLGRTALSEQYYKEISMD